MELHAMYQRIAKVQKSSVMAIVLTLIIPKIKAKEKL